jgi:hypothetical protein
VIEASEAAALAAALAAIGISIDSLELATRRIAVERCFSWPVLQTTYPGFVRWPHAADAIGRLTDRRGLPVVLAARATAALAAVAGLATGSAWAAPAALAVCLLGALVHIRLVYGLDGADQMQNVVWAGLALYAAAPGGVLGDAALAFVAIQVGLAYLTSGIAKAISPEWRSGAAIRGILATHSYGGSGLARRCRGSRLSRAACWGVIGFEIGAPLVALAGGLALVAVLAAAVVFHASIAIVMGLNDFFWAFVSPLSLVATVVTALH